MLCPNCGATNDDNSKFCQGCGGTLNEAVPGNNNTNLPETTDASAVPAYQPPVTPDANPVPAYQTPVAPAKAKKGKGCLIAVIVVVVLAIAVVVGGIVLFNKGKDAIEDAIDDATLPTSFSEETTQQNTTMAMDDNSSDGYQASQDEINAILDNSGLDNWDGNWENLTPEQQQAITDYYVALGQNWYYNEDGYTYEEDGETVQLGGQWPNSPLLNDVPKPGFGSIVSSSVADSEVDVVYTGWTPEQLTQYIGMVKAAGFTKNVEEMSMMGITSYEADNGSVMITVGNAMGFFTITVDTLD